jgi:anaerobic selenocysteine-containing dehydrogenase
VYGRIGTSTQEFGTLASWLVDVLNVLTGNLDREGGAMWPRPLAGGDQTRGEPGRGPAFEAGRTRTRVRGAPEVLGQYPAACLAEEIDTPGPGGVRALITMAGNPVLSAPDGERLGRALAQLDCLVAIDIFVNETTRHAHVILPGPSPLQQPHYDALLYQVAVRSFGRYSPPLLPLAEGALSEWQTLLRLSAVIAGQDWRADLDALDDAFFLARVRVEIAALHSPLAGRAPEEIAALSAAWRGPERILDLELRSGPFGDHYGRVANGLTLADLAKEHPHGLDLGPMEAGLPGFLHTPSGKIELAHPHIVADVPRLRAALARGASDGLLLIGRRDLRSNNSWLHNAPT